jgi:hypothetical protein
MYEICLTEVEKFVKIKNPELGQPIDTGESGINFHLISRSPHRLVRRVPTILKS